MKGVKKCFGLLLALPIMLGLSLSVSSGASATKHPYSSLYIPGYNVFASPSSTTSTSLESSYSSEYPQSNALSQPRPASQILLSQGSPCYNSSQSIPSLSSTSNTYIWSSSDFLFNVGLSVFTDLPSAVYDCHGLRSTSWYKYSSIPILASSNTASVNATIDDLFSYDGNHLEYMYAFSLPFTFNTDAIPITSGKFFHFSGAFSGSEKFYASDASGNTFALTSNNSPYAVLYFNGIDIDNNVYRGTYSWADHSSSPSTNYCNRLTTGFTGTILYFDCFFTAPADLKYATFSIRFQNYSPNDQNYAQLRLNPIWYNSSETSVRLFDFSVTTDWDDTPGVDASIPISGSDIESAPGTDSTSGISYETSLTNMFNFDFINPFAPLFNLFTDSSNCASIPIIAAMLGSSNSSYCPWFPSSVRSVLTPVFGIASTMLVFGFLVFPIHYC